MYQRPLLKHAAMKMSKGDGMLDVSVEQCSKTQKGICVCTLYMAEERLDECTEEGYTE